MTTNTIKRPFFTYYGAKFRAAKHYPAPQHDAIVEPFAGAAGYSCRYPERKVLLVEKSPVVAGIWQYLIKAPSAEILALPDLPECGSTHDLNVCQEARDLIGFWVNKAPASPCRVLSAWARSGKYPNQFWGASVRAHIASSVEHIRHWRVLNCGYEDIHLTSKQATWYVDPPYQKAGKFYMCPASGIDFTHLATWCRSRNGQVIVCENTGADWLPFRHLMHAKANRGSNTSAEAIWTNADGT